MVTVILLSFVFMLLVVAGMAVGVVFSNKPIKGSCGGIQNLGLGGDCDICGGDPQQCEKESDGAISNQHMSQQESGAEPGRNFYNASANE